MRYVEIETAENSRLIRWVRIYGDTDPDRLDRWVTALLRGVFPAPRLRVVDGEKIRMVNP